MYYVMAVMLIHVDLIILWEILRTMMRITVRTMTCRMVIYLNRMSMMTKAETYVHVYVHVVYSSFALNEGEKST